MESGLSSDVATRDHPAIRTLIDLGASGVWVNWEARGKVCDQSHIDRVQGSGGPRSKPQTKRGQYLIVTDIGGIPERMRKGFECLG